MRIGCRGDQVVMDWNCVYDVFNVVIVVNVIVYNVVFIANSGESFSRLGQIVMAGFVGFAIFLVAGVESGATSVGRKSVGANVGRTVFGRITIT